MVQQVSASAEQDADATRLALGRLARRLAELFDAGAALALLDAGSGDLATLAAAGFTAELARPLHIGFGSSLEGWVAAHQEPVLLDDVHKDGRFSRDAVGSLRAVLCAPLVKEDRLLGTLLVASGRPGAFDARRRETFLTIAAIVAEAVSGLLAHEASHAQLRAHGVLLETVRSLAGSLDGRQVLGASMHGLRRVTRCHAALIYWLDARAEVLRPAADAGTRFSGLLRAPVRLDDEHSLAAWVARARRARVAVVEDEETAGMLEARAAAGMALLAVPFLARDRLRGVAVLARPAPFTSEELALALNLCGVAASALDNVERYQLAKAERAQLAAIFASASDAMAIVDGTLTIVDANTAFAELMAERLDQLVGSSCCEVLRRRGAGACDLCEGAELLARALETGEAVPHVECAFPLPHQDQPGRASRPRPANRTVDFSLTPLAGPEGRRVLLVGRDVTAARAMDQMQAQFLSMVSHELRGPLMAINGYLDLVLAQDGFSDEQHGFLRRARAGSEHLKTLVDDLLLLSRRDAGMLKLTLRETDLSGPLRESVEEMEVLAHSGEVALELDAPRTLPLVRADQDRMKQVLRNLISNAIKFTPTGGAVRVSAGAADGQLELSVSDTGVGIAPEHLERIFDRFYQVDATTSFGRFPGQGLGLAIVRIIVDGHGGKIHVESMAGQGSTFTVRLPLAPDEE